MADDIYLGWSLLVGDKRYSAELMTDIKVSEMKGMTGEEAAKFLEERLLKAAKPLMINLLNTFIPRVSNPENVDYMEAGWKKDLKLDGSS